MVKRGFSVICSLLCISLLGGTTINYASALFSNKEDVSENVAYDIEMWKDEDNNVDYPITESSMLFVTSAGNQGENLDVNKQYPACYSLDNVITVASMGFDGELDSRSNYGKKYVDVVAPGTYLYSTCVNNSYNYDSGTSMATAVVTGIAAIIYANRSKVTPNEVKKVIGKNVILLDKFKNVISSGGYVDAKKAIEYALNL